MKPYPAAVESLLRDLPLSDLGPGTPRLGDKVRIEAAVRELAGKPGCQAGIWLAFDFLDESHAISQDLHTAEGSFWHAVMHRREPDAWNSKYWWRKVGTHPVFAALRVQAERLGWKAWDAQAFVDACEGERGTGSEREGLLREVQREEWRAMFAYCFDAS